MQLAPLGLPPSEGLAVVLLRVAEEPAESALIREAAASALERVVLFARLHRTDGEESAWLRGPAGRDLSERLRRLHECRDEAEGLRRAALTAACTLPGDWQPAAVRAALAGRGDGWRATALYCLKHLEGMEPEIVAALEDSNVENRRQALEAAGVHGVDAAWPIVLDVLRAPKADPDLRASALLTAAHLRRREAEEWIAPFLASEDLTVRGAATTSMAVAREKDTGLTAELGPRDGVSEPIEARAPEERAAHWLALACDEPKREERLELAWLALDAWPDSADAWVLLAREGCSDPELRIEALEEAVRAGERALGGGRHGPGRDADAWSDVRARPYLRARLELAAALREAGEAKEAVRHCRALLKLDPDDHVAARPLLLDLLLESGDDEQARGILSDEEDAPAAALSYGALLLALRGGREDEQCRGLLQRALTRNPHVPELLTGRRKLPRQPSRDRGVGSRAEAEVLARSQGPAWRATRGALAWLRANARPGGRRGRA